MASSSAAAGLPPASPRRGRRRHRLLLVVVVAILGVEGVLIAPRLSGVGHQLGNLTVGWTLAAVAAQATSMTAFAREQRRLLASAGTRVRLGRVAAVVYAGNAISVTLPGGQLFSTSYTFRRMRGWGASTPAATWTLAVGAVLSSVALALVGGVGALLVHGRLGIFTTVLDAALLIAVVLGVRALVHRPGLVQRWGLRVLRAANRVLRRPPETGGRQLAELIAQTRNLHPRPRDLTIAFGWSVYNWALDVACLGFAALAVGDHRITLGAVLVAYVAGSAASSLSLIPAGLGIVDAALTVALVAGGLPADTALAAVVLYRLISLVAVVAVGWILWAYLARRPAAPSGRARRHRPARRGRRTGQGGGRTIAGRPR